MRLYIFILSCFLYFNAFAQTIRGKVTDLNHIGIPFVSVSIVGNSTFTVTNDNGDFELKDVNQNSKLRFSHVSYQTLDTLVKINANELIVKLIPAHITLKDLR